MENRVIQLLRSRKQIKDVSSKRKSTKEGKVGNEKWGLGQKSFFIFISAFIYLHRVKQYISL